MFCPRCSTLQPIYEAQLFRILSCLMIYVGLWRVEFSQSVGKYQVRSSLQIHVPYFVQRWNYIACMIDPAQTVSFTHFARLLYNCRTFNWELCSSPRFTRWERGLPFQNMFIDRVAKYFSGTFQVLSSTITTCFEKPWFLSKQFEDSQKAFTVIFSELVWPIM